MTVVAIPTTALDPRGLDSSATRPVSGVVNTGSVTYDVQFPQFSRWLWFNLTGTVSYIKWDGTTQVLSNVVAGIWHPICAIGINSAGTTVAAANIFWGN